MVSQGASAPDRQDVERLLHAAGAAHAQATEALRQARELAKAVGVAVREDADITAQRINIVEPDGRLRLIISSAAAFPGLVMRGEEHEHPGRTGAAGLLFYNDEATEMGGLIYDGARTADGHASAVQLSYDNFEQDQVIKPAASDGGSSARVTELEFVDRPDWSILDLVSPGSENPGRPWTRDGVSTAGAQDRAGCPRPARRRQRTQRRLARTTAAR